MRWDLVLLTGLVLLSLAAADTGKFSKAQPVWSEQVLMNMWEPMLCLAGGKAFIFATNVDGVKACQECPWVDPILYRARDVHTGQYVQDLRDDGFSWAYLDADDSGTEENADAVVVSAPSLQKNGDNPRLLATYMRDWTIAFQSSDDLGQTWSDAVQVSGVNQTADKNWMVVGAAPGSSASSSPSNYEIYVTYNDQFPYSVSSTDSGRGEAWSAPVQLDRIDNSWFFACGAGYRASDRRVFYAYAAVPDQYPQSTSYSRVYSSGDGFRDDVQIYDVQSWQLNQTCPAYAQCNEPDGYLVGGCGLAVDDADTVYYVANAANADNLMRIMLSSLKKDQPAFSAPRDVSDAPLDAAVFHAFPMLACGRSAGDVRVAWMDNRTGQWNVWYRASTDGGRSWLAPSVRLSNYHLFGFQDEDGFDFPYGDYGSMQVDANDHTHIVWGEGYGWYSGGTVMYATTAPSPSDGLSVAGKVTLTAFFSAFAGILIGAAGMYWYKVRQAKAASYEVVDST